MRSMAWLKGLLNSLIWPAHFARADGDRAAQPMAQPRPLIAPALMCRGRSAALWGRCRRPFHAPRLGKGFTSQPGWTLGSAIRWWLALAWQHWDRLSHRGGSQTAPDVVFSNIPNPPPELEELRLRLREVLAKIGYCMAAGWAPTSRCYVTT